MDIYLVGGAVRDALLGLPVQERDWVVVGATVEEMLAGGFRQVGRDFPVFLHPRTHEEHALARTERKTAPGYRGFEVHAAPEVTLEEDLERRDLTINAMARDDQGRLIDPFGGQADLQARRLRHVSCAFAEDPVRILRVARFAARLAPMGFTVAPETMTLMRRMVAAGEVDALVPERVWQETERALTGPCPSRFFQVLRECGALAVLFPELECLYGVPQPPRHHPEVDTGVHTFMVLDQAERLSPDPVVRFAALTHDLGKGNTPRDILPSHHGHEQRGVVLIDQLCDRYRIPNRYREPARMVARYHGHMHRVFELRPDTLAKTLEGLDAYRRPERMEGVLLACEADYRGRTGFEERPYPQADYVRRAHARCLDIQARELVAQGLKGQAITQALRRLRIEALTELKQAHETRAAGAS
ncbi:multifunctional CCA addition/repair protein [Ectothiorhodospira lacustris]|uniref:multifunctional CCA addition/repair protein n=1 Tax=Ectothiorhodospira lacustris TaxID=2899127 RepID=UPI001EE81E0D|nr:multifunctional CCA addition/repair protein [Ectothiorhodospira lacustris]MCG5500908.1 multifunctional CCA addition/repair protein [Ectothiorhodospira lacustris]MCG5510587.1 multifunctional CCA addition/repair protein [Ectothiorhodospira lacustris]MCG5521279.1 multifunctional CCA addition/repair protein [Ectothiorhodospira lacustris]